ncbi:hypothetical protein [Nocardiopsis salina]|uniref:hypothetical protein n=1 Tax=Nocardiopsis salina TaxID=245836 RepID=UPI000346F3CE|nr:hypothetical protein [Nocardiopsis salina]
MHVRAACTEQGGGGGTAIEDLYHRLGYASVRARGQGMEGQVHHLGQGRVGKAWFWRTGGELRTLSVFYEEPAAQDLPWDSPRILGSE